MSHESRRILNRFHPVWCWLACFWSVVSFCVLGLASNQTQDFIRSRAVLEDPSGALTIEQVVGMEFTPIKGLLAGGYTDSVHWLRLQVNARSEGGAIKLRIQPVMLDEVSLYEADPDVPGAWKVRVTGDRHPYDENVYPDHLLGFVVQADQPVNTYYLRLKTTSSSIMQVEALSPREAVRKSAESTLLQIAYMSFIVWLLFWSMQDYLVHRQAITGYFALYQSIDLLRALSVIGYLAPFEPADSSEIVDKVTNISIFCSTACSILFNYGIFKMYATNRYLQRGLLLMLWYVPVLVLADVLGHERQALQLNTLLLLVQGLLCALLAWTARQEGSPSRRVLRMIYAIYAVSGVASFLPLLGMLSADQWNIKGLLLVHVMISPLLMFYMLLKRSDLINMESEKAKRQAALADFQLEIEREHVAEQSRFIDMLTHELKTPISVALMSLGAIKITSPYLQRIGNSLGNMNAIIDRARMTEKIDHKRMLPQWEKCSITELLFDCIGASVRPDGIKTCLEDVPDLMTDPQLLWIIVSNLLDNALKYSDPQDMAEVRTGLCLEQERSGLCLVVSNAPGVAGIPDPDRVFKKYYRSAGAKRKSGSGLGLYLSRSMADLIGARLNCQLTNGRVEFVLWLPF